MIVAKSRAPTASVTATTEPPLAEGAVKIPEVETMLPVPATTEYVYGAVPPLATKVIEALVATSLVRGLICKVAVDAGKKPADNRSSVEVPLQ